MKLQTINEWNQSVNENIGIIQQLARAYKVNVDHEDVKELESMMRGETDHEVMRKDFKRYFNIPKDADENPDYEHHKNYNPHKFGSNLMLNHNIVKENNDESTQELEKEHERLVKVLKSKSHKDDEKEAKIQGKELEKYKEKLKIGKK